MQLVEEGAVEVSSNERRGIADRANEISRQSRRRGAPWLSAQSDVGQLLRWLMWCDPNGVYTEQELINEGFDLPTPDEAWDLVSDMCTEET